MVLGRAAFDEVARERERGAREPDQRNGKLGAQEPDGRQDLGNVGLRVKWAETIQVSFGSDRRIDDGTAAGFDADRHTHRRKRHHDVAEQYRCVQRHATERLEGDLDHGGGVLAGLQDVPVPPQLAVFGQITARLTHEPDRSAVHWLAAQSAQEPVGCGEVTHPPSIRRTLGLTLFTLRQLRAALSTFGPHLGRVVHRHQAERDDGRSCL